jgi:hypothetical protein
LVSEDREVSVVKMEGHTKVKMERFSENADGEV